MSQPRADKPSVSASVRAAQASPGGRDRKERGEAGYSLGASPPGLRQSRYEHPGPRGRPGRQAVSKGALGDPFAPFDTHCGSPEPVEGRYSGRSLDGL
jgi:hypothetical protein